MNTELIWHSQLKRTNNYKTKMTNWKVSSKALKNNRVRCKKVSMIWNWQIKRSNKVMNMEGKNGIWLKKNINWRKNRKGKSSKPTKINSWSFTTEIYNFKIKKAFSRKNYSNLLHLSKNQKSNFQIQMIK